MSESYSNLLSQPCICCEKFSKLLKAKCVVARCLRFINNIKIRREEKRLGELSVCEIQKAEHIFIGFAQKEGFSNEIMELKLGNPLPAKSPPRQLNPVLDSDGLLHMKGHLELAKHLSAETRNPILLPRKHHITTLIVAHKETTMLEPIMFYQTYEHDFRLLVDEKQSNHGKQDEMNAREDVLRPPDKS